jgi:hypothetical protein
MAYERVEDILAEARDRIIASMVVRDEFMLRASLQPSESVRQHIDHVLNEIEGLRRRLAELAKKGAA